MKRYDRITPEGTKDRLFQECEARRTVLARIEPLFREHGYREVMTPGFEFYDVFDSNSRYFPQESMHKLTDARGRLIVARPDSTIPIARVVATRLRNHRLPIRLHYSQSVFRPVPVMSGRSAEEMQTGIELIGSASYKSDLEMILLAAECMKRCGIEGYRIEIGHIEVYKRLIDKLDCDAPVKEIIRQQVESKNYAALNDTLDRYRDSQAAMLLKQLPRLFGGIETLERAEGLFGDFDGELAEVIRYLGYIYRSLQNYGLDGKLMMDFGLVQQAEYYTGPVFRGYLAGVGEPVLSGGRYDGLIRDFGENYAATGFGVNVDRIAETMVGQCVENPPDALVHCDAENIAKAFRYIEMLASSGITTEFSVMENSDQAREYAAVRGIPELHIVAEIVDIERLDPDGGDAQ